MDFAFLQPVIPVGKEACEGNWRIALPELWKFSSAVCGWACAANGICAWAAKIIILVRSKLLFLLNGSFVHNTFYHQYLTTIDEHTDYGEILCLI